MLKMEIEIFDLKKVFTPESLKFLKKFELWDSDKGEMVSYENENIYKLAADNILGSAPSQSISIDEWPDSSYFGLEHFDPGDLFSVLVNHFQDDGMELHIYIYEFDYAEYNVPEMFSLPYITYTFKKDEYDESELSEGKVRIRIDGNDSCFLVNEYDEISLRYIEGAKSIQLF